MHFFAYRGPAAQPSVKPSLWGCKSQVRIQCHGRPPESSQEENAEGSTVPERLSRLQPFQLCMSL
jgi:hypothetical protein